MPVKPLRVLIGMCMLLTACSSSMPMLSPQAHKIARESRFDQSPSQEPVRPITPELLQAFEQAMLQVSKLNYGMAVKPFDELSEQFALAGDRERAAESAFWHAFCLEKLGQTDPAIQAYHHIIATWPHTKASSQALQRRQAIPTP